MNFLIEETKHESNEIKIMNCNDPVYNIKNSSEIYKPLYNEVSGFRDFKRKSNYPKRARDTTEPIIQKNPFEHNINDDKKNMDNPFNSNSNLGMTYLCKSKYI
jgi:hypothetical protein